MASKAWFQSSTPWRMAGFQLSGEGGVGVVDDGFEGVDEFAALSGLPVGGFEAPAIGVGVCGGAGGGGDVLLGGGKTRRGGRGGGG